MDIITSTISKVKSNEVGNFLEQQDAQVVKFKKENAHLEEQKKQALQLYRNLHDPLSKYMGDTVTKLNMPLQDVIGNYWFRTPEGHFVTLSLGTFHKILGNRDVDPVHVAELINKFNKKGYNFNMSLVNQNGGVADGQHRLAALSYLQAVEKQPHPFIFDILPNAGIEVIEQQNTNRSERNPEDRLQSGMSLHIPDYEKLGELYYDRYKKRFPLSELIEVVCVTSPNLREDFASRNARIDESRYSKAVDFLDKVVVLFDTIYPEKTENKISRVRPKILIKLYHTDTFTYDKLLTCITTPQSPSVFTLQKMKSQNKEIICQYLLDAYNYKRTSNRLDVKTWQDLKNNKGTYNNLASINLK